MAPTMLELGKRVIEHENNFQGLCATIGFVAQNWAMLEQVFDVWISLIYHNLGGRTEIDPALPLNFKKKMRFLRGAFNTIAPLKPFRDKGLPIIEKAMNLAPRRNDLIHGSITAIEPENELWNFVVIDAQTPKDRLHWHVFREFKYGIREFQAIESKLVPLVTEAATLGHEILKLERT
jgi:hypothetical protein